MTDDLQGHGIAPQPLRFGEVGARNLPQLLVDSITETILREGLQPGSPMPSERDMCEQFGVGRGTLREALRVLEAEGLLTVRPRSEGGRRVSAPDPERLSRLLVLLLIAWGATLRDVYEARLALEPMAAREAAERRDPEAIAAMRRSLGVLEGAVADEARFIPENQNFNRLLGEASGNPVLIVIAMSLTNIFDGYAMGTHFSQATREYVVLTYGAIVDAIAAGDVKAAGAETLLHVADAISHLEHRFPELLEQPLRPTLRS